MKVKEFPSYLYFAARAKLFSMSARNRIIEPVNCIVSLTSIPERLKTLHLTIGSLLLQEVTAKKIILWLNHDLKAQIPRRLSKLEGARFEIRFRGQGCSHRKLIFALQEFSDETVVVCDDDVLYHKTWLKSLMRDHQRFPDQIIAHECREIAFDDFGHALAYKDWHYTAECNVSNTSLLPIGYGGVLYPPKVLHSDVTNEALYMALAPKADDLWFKAMSLLHGTAVRRSSSPPPKPQPIAGAKGNSLALHNVKQDGNRNQWQAISDHYQLHTLFAKER